jgi:hypothetical protein
MGYLERTGQANDYRNVEWFAGRIILSAWRSGITNRIRLANKAITVIEWQIPKERWSDFKRHV